MKVNPLSSQEIADAVELLIYSDIDSKKMRPIKIIDPKIPNKRICTSNCFFNNNDRADVIYLSIFIIELA